MIDGVKTPLEHNPEIVEPKSKFDESSDPKPATFLNRLYGSTHKFLHNQQFLTFVSENLNIHRSKKIFMGNSTSKKVLIVEDEGDMCLLINILLSGKGIELDHVPTLAGAEVYLKEAQPAVVILDNRLPDGLGLDFIPVIKKTHPATKVIMISGFDKAAEDVALENGADTYLSKPFTKEQLFAAVEAFI